MSYTVYIIIFISVFLIILLSLFLFKQKKNSTSVSKPSLIKGFSSIFEGDDKKALDELRKLALSDNGSIEIYLSIAFLYRKLGDYLKAAHIHEILLAQNNITKEYKLFILTELSKDYMLADMPLKVLQVLDSDNITLQNHTNFLTYAKAYLSLEKYDKAIEYYDKYFKYSNNNTVYGFKSKCLIEKANSLNDLSKSLKIVKSVLNNDEFCRPAHFAMATIYKNNKKINKAIQKYKEIINLFLIRDYKDIEIIEKVFVEAGEEALLYEITNEIVSKNIDNPLIHLYVAKNKHKSGNTEEAILILENYLINIKNLSYLSKEYAELKNDKVLINNISNNKDFKCKICNNDSETYSDNCSYCSSYDTLILR